MSKGIKITLYSIVALVLLIFSFMLVSGVYPLGLGIHDKMQVNEGVALSGYDVVSYHLDSKAEKGNGEFSIIWKDAKWQFSSQAHLDTFKITPEAFAPECGGYCVFASGKGFAASSNPDFWAIENGKLYMFANEDVKADWLADKEASIAAAKENWK